MQIEEQIPGGFQNLDKGMHKMYKSGIELHEKHLLSKYRYHNDCCNHTPSSPGGICPVFGFTLQLQRLAFYGTLSLTSEQERGRLLSRFKLCRFAVVFPLFTEQRLAWFTIEVTVLQVRKTTESQRHGEEKATRRRGDIANGDPLVPHLLVSLSQYLRVSVPLWLFSCMQKSVTLISLGNEPSPKI